MAFRLNESYLIHKVLESIPLHDIQLVCQDIPVIYVNRVLNFIGELLVKKESPHIEYYLIFIKNILIQHGRYISEHKFEFQASMKLLSRFLNKTAKDVVNIGRRNDHLLTYLTISKDLKQPIEVEDDENSGEEDLDVEDIVIDEEDDDEAGWLGPNEQSVKASNGIIFTGPGDDDSDDDDDQEELIEV